MSDFNIPEKKFGDEQFELNKPITNSDGAFIYSSLDESVATIVGSTVIVNGAGVTDITATQIETSNYLSETILTTITVIKATTILSNFNIPDQTVGNADFDLEEPGSNRLGTFIYTSSNPLVATIYGKTVRIMGAGYADITATQETTSDYFAETIITKLNVNKAPTTLTRDNFKDLTKTFGDLLFGLSAPVSNRPGLITYSSLNETVATIFESSVTILGAGTSVITAIQEETFDYLSETLELILTVNKALPTISNFVDLFETFGNPSFDLSATSDSSGVITYSSLNPEIATIVGNKVTIVAIGLAVITASQAETVNHLAATQTLELTINKAAPIISNFVDLFETFGNPSFDLSATSDSPGLFSYSSLDNTIATIVGNKLNIVGAGTTVISVLQAGTSNYLEATKTLNLTVYKAVPIISNFLSFSKTFGDSSFDLSATSSSPAAIIYSSSNTGVASVSGKNVTIVAAGLTVITLSQSETPNYLSTIQTLELTINKATPTIINFSNLEKTFGNPSFDLSDPTSDSPGLFSYSSSNAKVVSIIEKNVTIVGAEIATITAIQAETDNYLAASITCLITILKRATILSNFSNLEKTFGDNVFTLSQPTSDRMQFI